jgi:hypothetical protein
VLIFLEPRLAHFMYLPMSHAGVPGGSGTVAGVTSRSWQHSRQYTHKSLSAAIRSPRVTGVFDVSDQSFVKTMTWVLPPNEPHP